MSEPQTEAPSAPAPPASGTASGKTKASGKGKAPPLETAKEPHHFHHPPFGDLVKEAILTLKEREGSSVAAIRKFIGEKYKDELPANWETLSSHTIRKMAATGNLVKIKASYKLSPETKHDFQKATKPKKRAAPEAKAKKPPAANSKAAATKEPKKAAAPKKTAEAKPEKAAATKTSKAEKAKEEKPKATAPKVAKTEMKAKVDKPKSATKPKAKKSKA